MFASVVSSYSTDNIGRRYRTFPAVELAVSSCLSQSAHVLSHSQVGRV